MLNVTVAGDPKVTVTQPVSVSGLVAIPWAQGDRSGVAFRADAIGPRTRRCAE
ncbi:putative regulatory protein [Mycobacterium xenopi 4042]|uniref:Putative regulatory protein n=1 Tax=Mycobacterium xenopi 4042 TaxID=1299334 RepID=X8BG74_MYCXE|nr:putative regulatory protein [Mycobacterium xenopi 4042]